MHVFDALLETAISIESSCDIWTLADIFFDNFDPEQDIATCFAALDRNLAAQSPADAGFDAKTALRLEHFVFRVTEATALMIGDEVRHRSPEFRSETTNRIFNGILCAAFEGNLRRMQTPAASNSDGTCVELLSSAFEKCFQCVREDETAQGAGGTYATAEAAVGFAADSISNSVFQAHSQLCVKRLKYLVNLVASLHSQSSTRLASLLKLLRNMAIDGRYRSVIELLGSRQQPLDLRSRDISVVDIIWHLCSLECIRGDHPEILQVATQNKEMSKILLSDVRPRRFVINEVWFLNFLPSPSPPPYLIFCRRILVKNGT